MIKRYFGNDYLEFDFKMMTKRDSGYSSVAVVYFREDALIKHHGCDIRPHGRLN